MQGEYGKINGRFVLVKSGPNEKVVGLVGSLWADDLLPYEIAHIREFYNIPETAVYEKCPTCDGATLPVGNFNNFLRFSW